MIIDPRFLVGWAIVKISIAENGMLGLGIFWMFHWPLCCLPESVLSSHIAVRTSKVTFSVHAANACSAVVFSDKVSLR